MQRKDSSLVEKVEEIYDYQKDPDEVEKHLTDLRQNITQRYLNSNMMPKKHGAL